MSAPTIGGLLAAAEPAGPRQLGELIDRLARAGLLHGAREGGKAIGPAALAGLEIRGVSDDSRRIGPGGLFVAVRGAHVDGHDLVQRAADAGAVAAIVEQPLTEVGLPQVVVDRSPAALADAAAWWYGDPSHELGVVGITGTDGKTTTSFLAVAALEAAGLSSGMLGTVETKIGVEPRAEPGAHDDARAPRSSSARCGQWSRRVTRPRSSRPPRTGSRPIASAGIAYDAAILTNLSHEHLEFHGTWEAYRDAKLSLFERLAASERNPRKAAPAPAWPKIAVVNVDDPSAGLFVGVAQEAGARIVTYGTDPAADVRATRSEEDARGLRVAY